MIKKRFFNTSSMLHVSICFNLCFKNCTNISSNIIISFFSLFIFYYSYCFLNTVESSTTVQKNGKEKIHSCGEIFNNLLTMQQFFNLEKEDIHTQAIQKQSILNIFNFFWRNRRNFFVVFYLFQVERFLQTKVEVILVM